MAVVFNLEVNIGAALIETFTIRDGNGDPVDLTGYEGSVTFFEEVGGAVLFTTKSTLTSKISLGTTNGQVTLKIPAGDLDGFPVDNDSRFHIDIWDTSDGETFKTREIRGNVIVIGTDANESP